MQAQPHAQSDCRVWQVAKPDAYVTRTVTLESPRRGETEHFIRTVFTQHYAAQVNSLAPDLMRLEQAGRIAAAAGWRGASGGRLCIGTNEDLLELFGKDPCPGARKALRAGAGHRRSSTSGRSGARLGPLLR